MAFTRYVLLQNTRTKEEERIRRVFKQEEVRLRCGPAPETLLSSFTSNYEIYWIMATLYNNFFKLICNSKNNSVF